MRQTVGVWILQVRPAFFLDLYLIRSACLKAMLIPQAFLNCPQINLVLLLLVPAVQLGVNWVGLILHA